MLKPLSNYTYKMVEENTEIVATISELLEKTIEFSTEQLNYLYKADNDKLKVNLDNLRNFVQQCKDIDEAIDELNGKASKDMVELEDKYR